MIIFLKNKQNWIKLFLPIVIFLIAVFLRTYQIGKVPASPDWDEVALGYNAYSILLTGRDEYGKFLPVVLRSFDDYKPALYAYLVIPFIKIFDLTVVAVRFPSVIFGVLAVFLTYYIVKELFSEKELFIGEKKLDIDFLALLSAFLLAISPWHIQFSRIGFEANVGLSFNLLAVLLFLKSIKNPPLLMLSFIIASLNIYVYQSEKAFTPLLMLALIIIYSKKLLGFNKKIIFGSLLLSIFTVMPMIIYIASDQNALLRVKGVSVFSDQTEFLKRSTKKILEDTSSHNYLGLILDNRRFEYVKVIISGYISHFDLNWLFLSGDINRHHAPGMGLLYLAELPFVFIGMYGLIFGKFSRTSKLVVFTIFLLAPIPASITNGVPHAIRTINFLPTFQIFTALGLLNAFLFISNLKYKIAKIRIRYLIFSLCILLFIFNFLYYINQYFVQMNYFYSYDWQYGYENTVKEIKKIESKYSRILVHIKPPLDQSYMFFLFYLKFSPSEYQKVGKFSSGGFNEVHRFGKYQFLPFDWQTELKAPTTLFIGRPLDFSSEAKILKTIYYLDGREAILIVQGE